MQVISEKDIKKKTVVGEKGKVEMMDFLEKPSMIIGTRIVPPNSSVPPKPHSHKLRQINYVIEGEPTLTNGKESIKLKKAILSSWKASRSIIIQRLMDLHMFSKCNLNEAKLTRIELTHGLQGCEARRYSEKAKESQAERFFCSELST